MKLIPTLTLASTLACALTACALTPVVAAPTNAQIDATNFLVNDNCSATYIGDQKFLTAAHCLEDQYRVITRQKVDKDGKVTEEKIRIATPGTVSQFAYKGPSEVQKTTYVFKVLKTDTDVDLGLVSVEVPMNRPGAPMACSGPKRMDTVYAVGNSLGFLYATVSKGIVSNTHRSYGDMGLAEPGTGPAGDRGMTQHTAAMGGGNSGGALYNDNGEVVGVNVRGYQAVAPLGFAVELQDIRKFLTDEGLGSLWNHCNK